MVPSVRSFRCGLSVDGTLMKSWGTLKSLQAQALALVPLVVGMIFGALVLPRRVPPDEIPAPSIDGRALSRTEAEDDARAARVARAPLTSQLRAVGSDFRAFNIAEGTGGNEATIAAAREQLFQALRQATDADPVEGLLDLRAFQMRSFLEAVRHFEHTGETSPDLLELGGTFVARMQKVGWCVGHTLLMSDEARRAAFKATWTHTMGLDSSRAFALTLDEHRALYAFYFKHPHATELGRARLGPDAPTPPGGRERIVEAGDRAAASWLLTKISELAKIDPTYPTQLGQAAALYLRRDYRGSASLYQSWLETHPNGAWTLRVQNHLRAALLAAAETGA
jgi:hypothetical protein